jgi:hypothetical protein
MENADLERRSLLWGYLLVTTPAVAAIGLVLFFRDYLFITAWPYYLTTGVALAYQWYTVAMPRWRMAVRNRGLSEGEVERIAHKGGLLVPGASSAGLLALHTTAAGLCTTYLSLWLAGLIVRWFLPVIGEPAPPHLLDFYLRHFELATIVPAFLLGCVVVRKFPDLSTWAWLIPALVLLFKLATFADQNVSALDVGHSWHRFSYYFAIKRIAPTITFTPKSFDISGPDPVRVLEQMQFVGSFYGGMAYSIGAFATKSKGLQRIWESLSREPDTEFIEADEASAAVIPDDPEEVPVERK